MFEQRNCFAARVSKTIVLTVIALLSLSINAFAQQPCDIIYVSPGVANAPGTPTAPTNLPNALTLVSGTRVNIRMLEGTYTFSQVLTLLDNVKIDGGYRVDVSGNWVKRSDAITILNLSGSSTVAIGNPFNYSVGQNIGFSASNISNWALQDLDINVASAPGNTGGYGNSVYGIHIANCTGYNIARCVINTGAGGEGLGGSSPGGSGGAGGAGSGGAGGAGGQGCGDSNSGDAGTQGSGVVNGGAGGTGFSPGCNFVGCNGNQQSGNNGSGGGNGSTGSPNYSAGSPATTPSPSLSFYVPTLAGSGGTGTAGGGGGGGGGATGGTCVCAGCSGPGGGNGGNGGNAGFGGSGGFGGGGSFAVYVFGGTGTILDCALNAGSGGQGGSGGNGQPGGGGSGGSTGGVNSSCLCGSTMFGGTGGPGGNGGNGGRGQDGATGASQALVQLNSASVSWIGTSVPNPTTVTVNYGNTSACTNSEITITKAAGVWTLPSGATFDNDLTPTTSTYNTSSNTAIIVLTNTGAYDLSVAGTPYKRFLNINTVRAASTIDALGNVNAGNNTLCQGSSITLSTPTVGDQYEWKVYSDAAGPAGAIYTFTTQNPGSTGAFTSPGHYYARLRVHTVCCGWSTPVFSGFTVVITPTVTIGPDRFICPGVSTTLTASGTTGNYVWNTSSTNPSINVSPSSTTTYSVTVTDANGCTSSASINVNVSAGLAITGFTNIDASCAGGNNGSSTVQVTGGFTPYTYSWSSGAAGQTATNLAPGSYDVTVHDFANCSVTGTTTINTAPPVVISGIGVSNILCNGTSTGSLVVTASGGTGGLQYSSNGVNFQASNILANLPAGFYTVTVKDANGCSATGTATITQPSAGVNISNVAITNVACNGTSIGQIVISATGGNGTLRYSINNGATFQVSPTFSGLPAGTNYNIIVKDGNGCTTPFVSNPVSITQPPALNLSIDSITNLTCNGVSSGAIYSSATGGAGNFQFSLNGSPYQQIGAFTGLAAGNYTVLVQDGNTCTQSAIVTLTQPNAINISNVAVTNVLCNGASTGAITVTATGGTGTLQYAINGGGYQASNVFSGLGAGSYSISVQDANGCTKTSSANITQPATALSLSNVVATSILCNGGTGSIVVTASGGTGTIQYSINGGTTYQATGSFTGLAAGTNYNVQVKDANGCTVSYANNPVSITQPTLLTLNIDSTIDVACNGGSTGRIVVSSTGGAGGNTYSINGGPFQGGTTFSGIPTATYTVTVKDANGCTKTQSTTITEPTVIAITGIASTNVVCNGAATGTITIAASGGTGVLTYSIDGVNFNPSNLISNLPAGSYTVTVKDANGCTKTASANISQPATAVNISNVASTNVACNGGTGSITVTAAGGTGALSYSINGGTSFQSSNIFSGLASGQYTIVVKDASNCTVNYGNNPVNLTSPSGLTLTITNTTDATCFGGSNGSITVSATGGSQPYQFSVNGGPLQSGTLFNNLIAGSYSVVVKDANGCTDGRSAIIGQPTLITISNIATANVQCNGTSTGSITVTASGGTGALTYSINGINFQPSNTFSNLAAGSYTITIKDANSCTTTGSTTISQPTTAVSITNVAKVNVACNGGTTGSINISAVGGTGALSYSVDGTTFQASNNVIGLGAGTYTVVVKDANGCTVNYASNPVTITEPTLLNINIDSVVGVSCNSGNTGKIIASATGGTTPYQFSLNGGPLQSGSTFTGLGSGTYTVLVQDGNACTVSTTATVSQPTQIAVTDTVINVTCFGNANGSVTVNAVGGTGPYNFSWSNSQVNNHVLTSTISGLTGGSYSVTISDTAGCTINSTYNVTAPAQLVLTKLVTDVACFGGNTGAVDLTVTGGTGTDTYNWTGSLTTQDISGLTAGTYSVTVTDQNSCTATTSAVVNQADSLSVVGQIVNVTCNGLSTGNVFLTVTGGTPSYTYNWTGGQQTQSLVNVPAGTYSVTVTDRNSCTNTKQFTVTEPSVFKVSLTETDNTCFGGSTGSVSSGVAGGTPNYSYQWSNGPSTPNINNVPAGIYSVVVRDANGCTTTATDTVNQPTQIALTANITNPTCQTANGAVTVNATGGTGPYHFVWSNTHTDNGISSTISAIAAGSYTVTVNDASSASCSVTASYTVAQSTTLSATSTVTPALCHGGSTGSITVTATGGTTPYHYAWSGSTDTTATITGLAAGSYTATITDGARCTVTQVNNVTEPSVIAIQATVTNVNCQGTPGSILLFVSGGTPSYTYHWSNGINAGAITNITPGAYEVTVTDNNLCTALDSFTVTGTTGPTLTLSPTNTSCSGGDNGGITSSVTSGQSPYTYQWSNGRTTDTISGLAPGSYTLTVNDANHCTVSATVSITAGNSFSFTIAQQDVGCNGSNSSGQAIAIITGGRLPFQYSWSNNHALNDSVNSNLTAGNYGVTISDANGCSSSETFTINQAVPLVVNIGQHSVYLNIGDNVALTPTVTRQGTYTYAWTPSKGLNDPTLLNVTATPTSPTLYTLVVTEAGTGCTGSDSVDIVVANDWFVPNVFTPNGDGLNDVFTVVPRSDNKLTELRIYNRYGQKVFDRVDIPWDGKVSGADQPTSTFVYEGVIQKADGSTVAIKGDVTLIR